MNTEIDNVTKEEAILAVENLIQQKKNAYVVTPNIDHIVQLERGGGLVDAYKNADLILTDGKPLIWISKLYRSPIKEKISGSDFFSEICSFAAQKGYSMFFLGASEGVAAKAAENLKKKYKGLEIVGTYSPPFGFEKDSKEIEKIEEMISISKPDILILGLGCPKQESFIYNYRDRLGVPISFCFGASLDFAAGVLKRAPKWMSDCGLEWMFRILQEPKRLIKRYVTDAFVMIRLILKYM